MARCFEDAFMDLQSEYVSLCLEYLERFNVAASTIYIYLYQTNRERMFNAFFESERSIVSLGEIGTDDDSDEVLDIGTDDIQRLVDVCEAYRRPCPNEFKLVYDPASHSLDAQYGYEDYSVKNEVDSVDVFLDWIKEAKRDTQLRREPSTTGGGQ